MDGTTASSGGGMDPVSAIAGAVGQIFNTIGIFVGAGAQKYGAQKNLEVGTVQFEQAKTLSIYNTSINNNKLIIYLIIGLALMAAFIIYSRKK